MTKYKVIFKGVADRTEEGIAAFLAEFGRAYKMTPDAAKTYINRCRGLLYTFDDPARAEKARSFLEKIGAVAVIETEGEPEPPPPEESEVTVVMPGKPAAQPPTVPQESAPPPPDPSDSAAPMFPPDIPETAGFVPGKPPPPPSDPRESAPPDPSDSAAPMFPPDIPETAGFVPSKPSPPPVPNEPDPEPEPSAGPDVDAESPFNPSTLKFSGTANQVFTNTPNLMNEPSIAPPPEAPASDRPCPKCGRVVPAGQDECPHCHIFISKYEKMMAKKAAERRPATPAPPPISAPAPAAAPPREALTKAPAFVPEQAPGPSSSWSMISLVTGLLGLVIFFAGPVAVLAGIKALSNIRRTPGMGGRRMAVAGLVLGIVDTVGGAAAVVLFITGMNPFS